MPLFSSAAAAAMVALLSCRVSPAPSVKAPTLLPPDAVTVTGAAVAMAASSPFGGAPALQSAPVSQSSLPPVQVLVMLVVLSGAGACWRRGC